MSLPSNVSCKKYLVMKNLNNFSLIFKELKTFPIKRIIGRGVQYDERIIMGQ